MADDWVIDEIAHAGPEHLEPGFVAGDDRMQGRPDLAEQVRTEHSAFRWLLEPMLAAAGSAIEDVASAGSVEAAYTCVRADVRMPARGLG